MFLDINRTIADNINSEMKGKGRKQLELASYLGYSKQTVSKMLKGERTISASELKAIASFLSVSVNSFYHMNGTPVSSDIFAEAKNVKEDTKPLLTFLDTLSSFIIFNRKAIVSGTDGRE